MVGGSCCEIWRSNVVVWNEKSCQQDLWWVHGSQMCPWQDQAGFPSWAENHESVEGKSKSITLKSQKAKFKKISRDFPGCPVVDLELSVFLDSIPGWGTKIPTYHTPKKIKTEVFGVFLWWWRCGIPWCLVVKIPSVLSLQRLGLDPWLGNRSHKPRGAAKINKWNGNVWAVKKKKKRKKKIVSRLLCYGL